MAHQLVLTPDGKHVIVSHAQSDAVTVICAESLRVVVDRVSTPIVGDTRKKNASSREDAS
jgi:hypothetical protein